MKRLLLPLLVALALPTAVNAEVSQLSKSRPAWMEEKIKGCQKYPTKTQRDYCINVYSPYRNNIPNNSPLRESNNKSTNSITKKKDLIGWKKRLKVVLHIKKKPTLLLKKELIASYCRSTVNQSNI